MDIPKATIDGLRKKHGRIFASTIRLPSGNELEFVWRLPEMADWTISEEANRGSGGGISGAEAANRQIMAAVIVNPARAGIMDALRPYPLAINQWFSPTTRRLTTASTPPSRPSRWQMTTNTRRNSRQSTGRSSRPPSRCPPLAGGDEVSISVGARRGMRIGRTSGRSARPAMTLKSLVSLAVDAGAKGVGKGAQPLPDGGPGVRAAAGASFFRPRRRSGNDRAINYTPRLQRLMALEFAKVDIRSLLVDDALEVVEDALDRRMLRIGVVTEGIIRGWPKQKKRRGK